MHALPAYLQNLKEELKEKQTKKAARKIITEYFQFMSLESIKEELWILAKGTITNDLMEQAEKGSSRHDLLFGYEFLSLFMDAVHAVHTKWQQKTKK